MRDYTITAGMKKLLLFSFFLAFAIPAFATHNLAGEITYKWIAGNQYEITVTTYTRGSSLADRCDLTVYFGDGDSAVVPRINGPSDPNCLHMGDPIGNGIKKNIYMGMHIYPGPGSYTITMQDPNRLSGIMNIPNSVNTPFVLQASLVINPSLGNNSSAQYLIPPIDFSETGQLYSHNVAAWDEDGDSLYYYLTPCIAPNYSYPSTGSINVDPVTGDFTWVPGLSGAYSVAIRIEEYRCGVLIGYTMRDWMIEVATTGNSVPVLNFSPNIEFVAGASINFPLLGTDPDGNSITFSAAGGAFGLANSPATLTGNTFEWTTSCDHIRKEPYLFVFKGDDNGSQVLTDYQSMLITVRGEPVSNFSATPVWGGVQLTWDAAACGNAIDYNIYRMQLDSQGTCSNNIADYTLFNSVTSPSFLDYGSTGEYCYMVTTVFGSCNSTYESYSSFTPTSVVAGMNDNNTDVLGTVVFPSPASDKVTIEMKAAGNEERRISIINSSGQVIKSIETSETFISIDVTELASGLYYFTILGNRGSGAGKFLVIPGE
jgi:hypothetical protein